MISFGYYEINDLLAAVRFVKSISESEIAVYGNSQGGVTAIMCADSLKDVKCIISEAAFDNLENAIDNRFRAYLFIPGKIGAILMIPLAEDKLKINIDDIAPIKLISKIHIPIFIIGGEDDKRILLEDTIRLYEAANQPKELWIVPNAGHKNILSADPDGYNRKVLGFLKRNF
ncbi:MAG: prolyl oligopeptidase family serine peptidase [Ignavibacteria bacterium]